MGIVNTTTDPATPYVVLLGAMDNGGDPSRAIEAMEAQGQRQLMNSDRLPTNGNNGDRESADAAYIALGFTFGDPDPSDPLFRPATLPAGWKRVASDHSMWSYIVDQLGRRRVAVFYKAAYYDRSAFMRLETTSGHCWSAVHNDEVPVTDDVWLTPAKAIEELTAISADEMKRATEWDARGGDGAERWADEHRARAAVSQRLMDVLAQS